ncbi:MAG: type II toxin-antitoxin system VapC family toxin [Actinobacteria bacterium]|nr:type II toxin-antitoxin system VapC family toxin [Actinomycetota bacterium]
MTWFADSSSLVKLYVPERGFEVVRALPEPLVVSALAQVEIASAFWRKQRLGECSTRDALLLSDQARADHANGRLLALEVTMSILADAERAVARHGLRAFDAVQLATAMAARSALGGLDGVATSDGALADAALAEGFAGLPREE